LGKASRKVRGDEAETDRPRPQSPRRRPRLVAARYGRSTEEKEGAIAEALLALGSTRKNHASQTIRPPVFPPGRFRCRVARMGLKLPGGLYDAGIAATLLADDGLGGGNRVAGRVHGGDLARPGRQPPPAIRRRSMHAIRDLGRATLCTA